MYNPNYSEKAIPLIAVNEHTGSKFYIINQSIKWPKMPSSSCAQYLHLWVLSLLLDSTELENLTFWIACYSIPTNPNRASVLDPPSTLVQRASGVGVLPSRVNLTMEIQSISSSSTLKELELWIKIKLMIPESSLWPSLHQAALFTTLSDPSMKRQFKIWVW